MKRFVFRAAAAAALAGCMSIEKVPFEHSSADFNDGKPHAALVSAATPEAAAERLIAAAVKRRLTVEERRCDPRECRLRLAGAPVDKEYSYQRDVTRTRRGVYNPKTGRYDYGERAHILSLFGLTGTRSSSLSSEEQVVGQVTDTIRMKFESVVLARVVPGAGGFLVELVGVPRRGGVQACPKGAPDLGLSCRPQPFPVEKGETPATSTLKYWGADVSGRQEAQLVQELLAELARR